ncbi:DUF788-domain-containing protein [Sodiomyces alkalinus F11]|uniref:DUF788-domain-containing protein n=1 Tax=Sodiomyces alkalinus (strain CBS 110278 / VKM F-3762 / F11) TaxID=1314773 RepID=A0A3N2PN39_SODAK|nr:DUF788-domain-containing protein [Sodiomyces alkalinus F11]ROT35932.1 DUF788-domain-containing protein [Sodiomyces alkalinus F11]
MAQKAKKDRAKSNAAALNNLHLGSAIVHVAFLLFYFVFKSRSLFWYILISVPALACELVLEKSGRPKYDATRSLKTAGEDLAAPGLTEYMFDIIWVTWASIVLAILFGNWAWFLWLAVPAYGAYAGFGLVSAGRKMAGLAGANDSPAAAPAGNRKQRRAA